MKKFKEIIVIILSLTMLIMVTACGKEESTTTSNISANELADAMQKEFNSTTEFLTLTENTFSSYYDVDLNNIEEYKVLVSSAFTAEEIAVFKVKDSGKTSDIETNLTTRKNKILDTFKDYNNEQYEIANKNTKIFTKGNYVILLTGSEEQVSNATKKADELLK